MSTISKLVLLVCLLFVAGYAGAQTDTHTAMDSVAAKTADTLIVKEPGDRTMGVHPIEITMEPREASNNNWMFWIMLLALGLVAFVRVAFALQLQSVLQAFANMKIAQQVYRDRLVGQSLGAFLLNLSYLLVLSAFVYLVIRHYGYAPAIHPMAMYGLVMAALSLYYIFRLGLLNVLAYILPVGDILGFYRFNILVANKLLGVALIPVVLLIAFSYQGLVLPFIYVGFALILGFFFVKAIKGILAAIPILAAYQFHFILYICTLEIAPFIIAGKLILNGAFHLAN